MAAQYSLKDISLTQGPRALRAKILAAQQAGLEIDPRFNFDGGFGPGVSEFQAPRQIRFGVKYIF